MQYRLVRSNRRTMAIEIRNGEVIVRTPWRTTQREIDRMLQEALAGIKLGHPETAEGKLDVLLSDPVLFAVDLTDTPLAERIQSYFTSMLAGPGAVRKTLQSL